MPNERKPEGLISSLGFYFGHTSRAMRNTMARKFSTEGCNVTMEQWHVLMLLWMKDGRSQGELAREASKEKATAARIIKIMERRGLIKKEKSAEDRRENHIYLTRDGDVLIRKLVPIAEEVMKSAVRGFNEDDIIILKNYLKKVLLNLNENKA